MINKEYLIIIGLIILATGGAIYGATHYHAPITYTLQGIITNRQNEGTNSYLTCEIWSKYGCTLYAWDDKEWADYTVKYNGTSSIYHDVQYIYYSLTIETIQPRFNIGDKVIVSIQNGEISNLE